jgi:hypothetical protein
MLFTSRRVSVTLSPQVRLDHFGMLLDLARGALGDGPAIVQGEYAIGHRAHQAHVVLDHEHGDVKEAPDVLDPEGHLLRLLHAQPRGGLIEE